MNKDSYNKIVNRWAEIRNKSTVNTPIVDFMERVKPGGNILDIGCGTGIPIARYLSEQNLSVTGIDFSDKMIEIAKSNGIKNAQFLVSDFYDFETEKKFEGIVAWDSLFHFPKERQRDIYTKIYDLLSPGGYFLFTHGREEGEHTNDMFGESFYYSCLSKEDVLDLFEQIGFKLESSIENFVEGNDHRDWVVLARKSSDHD